MITIKKKTYKVALSSKDSNVYLDKYLDFIPFEKAANSNKMFYGKYNDKNDEFVFRKNYGFRHNLNRPTIHMKITYANELNQSIVKVKYAFSNGFWYFYLVGVIFSSMAVFSWYIENYDSMYIWVYFLVQIILFVWMSIFGLLFFFFEYASTKRAVEDFMKGID